MDDLRFITQGLVINGENVTEYDSRIPTAARKYWQQTSENLCFLAEIRAAPDRGDDGARAARRDPPLDPRQVFQIHCGTSSYYQDIFIVFTSC